MPCVYTPALIARVRDGTPPFEDELEQIASKDLVRHRAIIVAQLERRRLQAFSLVIRERPPIWSPVSWWKARLFEREFLRAFAQTRGKDMWH